MQILVHLGGKPVTLHMRDFDDNVDTDILTSVDHSNLYGEAVTVSALLNHVGILKAQMESEVAEKKLDLDVYEAQFKQSARKSAVSSGEKVTENSLDEKVSCDQGIILKKKNLINAQLNLGIVDSLFWSVKSKDQKLNNLIKGVTPEELYNELIDCTINNIVVKKHRSITDPK